MPAQQNATVATEGSWDFHYASAIHPVSRLSILLGRGCAVTITPHTRALIQAAIATHGDWSGERDGVKFRVARQPDLFAAGEIHWQAKIGKRIDDGQAETVFDACSEIEKFSRRGK